MTELEPDALVLEAGEARLEVSPPAGGRIRSLTVAGDELLVTRSEVGPIYWGCYPMAPWAGRLREGRFAFAGRKHEVPRNLPPHAIHGVVFDRPWHVEDASTISIELDERWPFRGRVVQRFELTPDRLDVTLELQVDEPMPGVVGWHPWFRRRLVVGDPVVCLAFEARTMLRRDAAGIATAERVPPPSGPFDDAFTNLTANPVLEWPGRLRLELSSTCAWWVVFNERPDALCLEPQSGPPDAPNLAPEVVEPGQPLAHTMRWRWSSLRGSGWEAAASAKSANERQHEDEQDAVHEDDAAEDGRRNQRVAKRASLDCPAMSSPVAEALAVISDVVHVT